MINAVLVFNGQGQPRLTKFYTQLVRDPDRLCFGIHSVMAMAKRTTYVTESSSF